MRLYSALIVRELARVPSREDIGEASLSVVAEPGRVNVVRELALSQGSEDVAGRTVPSFDEFVDYPRVVEVIEARGLGLVGASSRALSAHRPNATPCFSASPKGAIIRWTSF